ncbi:MAG: RNA polymerase sigma factor [Planctomycetia bacterium]|nr:RNA polymerase sigma factor [Planctomycetia bacterium]
MEKTADAMSDLARRTEHEQNEQTSYKQCDADLVVAFQQGHQDAFDLIDQRYRERLMMFLARRGIRREESLDIVQQTLFQASQKLHTLQDGHGLAAWLYRIAIRIWIDEKRKGPAGLTGNALRADVVSLSLVTTDYEPATGPRDDPAWQVAQKEERRNIWALAQKHLSPVEFELLWLKYVDELEDSEIAAAQSRSRGAIRTGLHRVRRKLIEILKSEKVLE